MKTKVIILLGLLVVTASYFFVGSDDNSLPEKPISQPELTKSVLPSPDELWEQQQQKVAAPIVNESTVSETENDKPIIINTVSKPEQNEQVTRAIPTPDELWEQQQQVSSEDFLPSDTPEVPVDPLELVEQEAVARLRQIENANTDTSGNTVELFDDLDNIDLSLQQDVKAATVPESEAQPIELDEIESLYQNRDTQAYVAEKPDSLIDPVTGLPEHELNNYTYEGEPVESNTPIEEFPTKGDQQ